MSAFSFTLKARSGHARSGTIRTPHGEVQTPCFMAVGTQAALKGISMNDAEDAGVKLLLANTYHLALRPGADAVAKLGGLHNFCSWHGPMLTDSGGYQVFSLAANRKITEEGVAFRSHIDGAKIMLSPEESITIQRKLGADIIMAFDECPDAKAEKKYHRDSLERTLRWLNRCVDAWQKKDMVNGSETQALYGIVQGGLHQDLREYSLEKTVAVDLPGYAIGGLSVGETADERNMVLDWIADELPQDKPRYLMGVGTPLDLIEAIDRGIDQFDCVLPTRMGRHGIAYTDNGPLHCKRAEYADDERPLDENTTSSVSRYSRAFIRHLLKAGEMLGGQIISLHNLAYYQQLMRRAQHAIQADEWEKFAASFRISYQAGMERQQ